MDGPVVGFYRHQRPSDSGYLLVEVWGWDHQRLESVHDYIQWLFPLDEPSRAVLSAPVLRPDEIAAFRDDDGLKKALGQSFAVMSGFYGFRSRQGGDLALADDFPNRRRVWLQPGKIGRAHV